MIVLDAAAAVDHLLRRQPMADWVEGRMRGSGYVCAPHLLDVEVLSALRRTVLRGDASVDRARAAVDDYALLRVWHYPHTPLLDRIWELHENLTPADAAYVALAERLDVALLTTDLALARSPGHRATIHAPG